MQYVKLKGSNRNNVGGSQGFIGISIRDAITRDTGTGADYPCMETAVQFTPEEAQRLATEPLILRIIGVNWPPFSLSIGDDITPEELEQLKKYHAKLRAGRILSSLNVRSHG